MIDWAIATKMAQPLAAAAGRVGWEKLQEKTLTRRVVSATYKRARKEDIRFTKDELKHAIRRGSVLEALLLAGQSQRDKAATELRKIVYSDEAANRLLTLITSAYIELSAQHADQAGIAHAIDAVKSHVTTEGEATRASLRAKDKFADNLRTVHPLRGEWAEHLRPRWPGVVECVDALASIDSRGELINDWARVEPNWLTGAPADAYAWLGLIADDYSDGSTSVHFYEKALNKGVSSRSYWLCRIAMNSSQNDEAVANRLEPVKEYPLAAAILAGRRGDKERALSSLEAWTPVGKDQATLKHAMRAQLLLLDGQLDEAIDEGDAAFRAFRATGPALISARARLIRASKPGSLTSNLDLEEALTRALEVRDLRRDWRMPAAAEAALVAAQAARLIGNPEHAWRIVNNLEGEATALEANNSVIINYAATMAAENDLPLEVKRLRPLVQSPAIRKMMDGFSERNRGNEKDAAKLWNEALALTDDYQVKFELSHHLALVGELSTFIADLETTHPEVATLMRRMAQLFRGEQQALAETRAAAHSNRGAAMALVTYYERTGADAEAMRASEVAAERWNDPDLWMRAGVNAFSVNELDRAEKAARKAISSASGAWGGRARAHRLLFEIAGRRNDWEAAAQEAMTLVQTDRFDRSASWALCTAWAFASKWEDALYAYVNIAGRPDPRSEDEAVLVANLFLRYGEKAIPLPDLLQRLATWNDSERVRGAATLAVLMHQAEDADVAELGAETVQAFVRDFPDSRTLIHMSLDLENPLEVFDRLFKDLPDYSELERLAARGQLPVGMIAELRPRSYSEAIVLRAAGHHFAGGSDGSETKAITTAIESGCVIDATAAHTLVVLRERGASLLRGLFADLTGAREQERDATQGIESLARMSNLTVVPNKTRTGATLSQISEDSLGRMREESRHLREVFGTVQTVPTRLLPRAFDDDRLGFKTPWLAATDLALSQDRPLWCDDSALRALVASKGIKTFTTFDLLSYARATYASNADLFDAATALLIARGYVGVGFDSKLFHEAAAIAGERRVDLASAIRFSTPTDPPGPKMAFVLEQMADAIGNPLEVREWARVSATWLVETAGSDTGASSNIVLFLRTILLQGWATSASLPFVLAGLHDALDQSSYAVDAITQAFRMRFSELIPRLGASGASAQLRGLMAGAQERDQRAVTHAILTGG